MCTNDWAGLAARQDGIIARRQLRSLGVGRNHVRDQVAAGRWALRSSTVVSTFTGPLQFQHRMWLGVLHAGGSSLVGGLSAATAHGLHRWERDEIAILVDDQLLLEPLPGVRWVRTRRSLATLRDPHSVLPLCRLEPALLLFAAYLPSSRMAHGVLASAVQQRVTTAPMLTSWIGRMQPLRRAARFRQALEDIGGGAQSMGEIDIGRVCRKHSLPPPTRQVRRRDSAGHLRFTDCEWSVADGRVIVLEIDGGFHMEVEHWEDDIARQRRLSSPERLVIRCTTRELRDQPGEVVADLVRLGVTPGRVVEREK